MNSQGLDFIGTMSTSSTSNTNTMSRINNPYGRHSNHSIHGSRRSMTHSQSTTIMSTTDRHHHYSNKLVNSPPSQRSRSNSGSSTTNVQHDQIPIKDQSSFSQSSNIKSHHSSASYKQELMDSSLLLDNINDVLSYWDNHQSNSHSLQTPNNAFSPNLSSNNTNNQPLISS